MSQIGMGKIPQTSGVVSIGNRVYKKNFPSSAHTIDSGRTHSPYIHVHCYMTF